MMLLAPARGKAVSSCSPAMYDALLAYAWQCARERARHWARRDAGCRGRCRARDSAHRIGPRFPVQPPLLFYGIRSALVITYLFITEAAKRKFYARLALAHR